MELRPYPYVARARIGEQLVAESSSCICAVQNGAPPLLWFPAEDIDLSALAGDAPSGQLTEFGGVRRLRTAQSTQASHQLSMLTDPSTGFGDLAGYGTFDSDDVTVEVVDRVGPGPEDVSLKQFPTWGDALDLVDVMNVRREGDRQFTGIGFTDGHRPVVEASQMLGQAIVGAGRLVPGRRVVSASMIFVRPADAAQPLEFEFDAISSGRTFSGESVAVVQNGRRCAVGTLLLDATAPAVVVHSSAAPDVPGPAECVPYDMGVTGRDLRVADAAYTNDPDAPVGPPRIECWVRFRALPDDPPLHAGLLAQFTGHMSIAASLRPHAGVGQASAHRTLSMGINAISISFHHEVRADRWMLYRHLSTSASDGMTHAECRVHDEDGLLLASFSVDAMIRPFGDGSAMHDARTAL